MRGGAYRPGSAADRAARENGGMAGEHASAADEMVAALIARYRQAQAEMRRLSVPDDHGAGERTARLSGLGAWEIEAERVRREIERLTGAPWPPGSQARGQA